MDLYIVSLVISKIEDIIFYDLFHINIIYLGFTPELQNKYRNLQVITLPAVRISKLNIF